MTTDRHPDDCVLCAAPGITVHYYAPPPAMSDATRAALLEHLESDGGYTIADVTAQFLEHAREWDADHPADPLTFERWLPASGWMDD